MLPALLSHLLGAWLLLGQLPRELSAQESSTAKLCGRELARAPIRICGNMIRVRRIRNSPLLPSVPEADIAPSSINEDTESFNMMSEFDPDFEEEAVAEEEIGKIIENRHSEAEDNSPSESKNLGLAKHSQKKRRHAVSLADKCCNEGCNVPELARMC